MAAFVTFLFLIFKPVMQLITKLLSLQVILICSWQHPNVTRYIRTDQREVSVYSAFGWCQKTMKMFSLCYIF